jgi:hypothetical protein
MPVACIRRRRPVLPERLLNPDAGKGLLLENEKERKKLSLFVKSSKGDQEQSKQTGNEHGSLRSFRYWYLFDNSAVGLHIERCGAPKTA